MLPFIIPKVSNATTEVSSHAEYEAGGHEEVDEPRAERQTRSSRKTIERREIQENDTEEEERQVRLEPNLIKF